MSARSISSHTYSDARGTWSVPKLWQAVQGRPIEVRERQSLEHFLDDLCWGDAPFSPRDVVTHTDRILKADLSYPIILSQCGVVMDGMHRLAKAVLLDHPFVMVQQFDLDPPPDLPSE